jgi:pimeloyl-ACP methyl ester carboxylesterase
MTRVSLADVDLSVCDSGQGHPILLLHGFPTTHLLWRGVMPALESAGFRSIAPDLAGFGESAAPEGLDIQMANQAGWMFALLDALRLDERPVVAAHDIGSAVAQLMVARDPERIRGLILIDGVYADNWAMGEVESIRSWDPAEASRLPKLLGRRVRAWSDSANSQELLREMLAIDEGESAALRIIRAARSMVPRSTAEILEELRRHHPPTLVLWGDSDRFLPVESVGKPLAALLGAELKVLPGGHFLPLDCPHGVAAEIQSFARSLPPEL